MQSLVKLLLLVIAIFATIFALLTLPMKANAQAATIWFPSQNAAKLVNSSWGLWVPGLATSTTGCLSVASNGWISPSGSVCGSGSGGGADFIPGTAYGTTTSATTTPLQAWSGVIASSTSHFQNASTTQLTVLDHITLAGSRITDFVSDATIDLVSGALRVVDVVCTGCLGTTEIAGLDISDDTNLSATTPILLSGDNLVFVGLATTTQPSSSNLLVSNGAAGVYGVATSTLTPTSPLTGSFVQIGSGGSLGCQTASGSQAGCLSSTDWTTFNSKESALTFTSPLVRASNTISFTGLATTSQPASSNVLISNGAAGVYGVATSTLTPTSPLGGSFVQIGSGGSITIQNAAADGSTKGAASFTAADFDASSGNISIDYTNGQAASATAKGFLTAANFLVFNNKIATGTNPTIGHIPYWSSSFPATLHSVATSSVTINAPLTSAGTPGFVVGGSGWTLDVDDIGAADLASADFGDFTCNGATCTVDANSIALATDTTGNFVATIAGTAGQVAVSGSGSEDAAVTLSLPSHVIFPGNFNVTSASTTNATSTNHDITNLLTFNAVTGNSWDDFCTAITGGAGLCDGNDATGAGGAGYSFTSGTAYGTSTSATTTALQAWSGMIASSTSHFSNATTTQATTLGASWFTSILSKMLYTDANGLLTGAGATTCTNQFVRAMSAAYIATCATVSPADIDLTAAFSWTGNQDFGGASFLEIPNGTNPTANDVGEIAHDTTDNMLILDDYVIGKATERIWGVTVASTSPAFIGAGLLAIPLQADGYTITQIQCYVSGGTSKVIAVEDASANSTEDITCATTATTDDGTITNATFTAAELGNIDFGATTGAVDYVTIAVFGQWTRE